MNVSKSIILGLAIMVCFAITAVFANPAHTGTLIIQKLPADDQDSSSGNVHDFTGLPLTDDGWTDFRFMIREQNLYQDARVIFVSNSEGNDGTGKVYSINDITFDSNGMFQPVGPVNAFKSIDTAYKNIRNGYPDILLLKRGDEWDGQIGSWSKSGPSLTSRIIIGSYGTGKRPLFKHGGNTAFGGGNANNIILAGLHFQSLVGEMDNSLRGRAIDVLGTATNHLYEDIYMDWTRDLRFQGSGGPVQSICVRRSVLDETRTVYGYGVYGLLFEENLFYKPVHKGRHLYWNNSQHSPYNGARGNMFFESTAGAIHLRSGGFFDNNLVVRFDQTWFGGKGGNTGQVSGALVTNNVFHAHRNGDGTWATVLANSDGTHVYGNIHTNGGENDGGNIVYMIEGAHEVRPGEEIGGEIGVARNINIYDNVVYGWSGGSESGILLYFTSNVVDPDNVNIYDNDFQMVLGQDRMVTNNTGYSEGFLFENNRYYSPRAESTWFSGFSSFAGWAVTSGETGSVHEVTDYPDPSRTVATYNQEVIGRAASMDDFMSEARNQSRHNWRSEYTACEVNNYIRQGFGKKNVECDSH